jgi:hypothetical protein
LFLTLHLSFLVTPMVCLQHSYYRPIPKK